VEILFNLLWVTVAIGVCAVWFADLRTKKGESLLPCVEVQLIALAVLVLVLLPVISLTDDLQACTAPAETEHLSGRGDLQYSLDQPLQGLPLSLALVASALTTARMPVVAFVATDHSASQRMRGFCGALATRPPPAG